MLRPGETLESPRVFDALGPAIALNYHFTYEMGGAAVQQANVVFQVGGAAGVAKPPRGEVDHRVAALRVEDVVPVIGRRLAREAVRRRGLVGGLAAAPAVEGHDRRERTVTYGGERHVDVERDAVE